MHMLYGRTKNSTRQFARIVRNKVIVQVQVSNPQRIMFRVKLILTPKLILS